MQPNTHKKRHGTLVLLLVVLVSFLASPVALAQDPSRVDPSVEGGEVVGLVSCGRDTDGDGEIENPCDFNDLIQLAQNLINWLVFFAAFVAAAMLTYAGFLYATSAGSEEKVKKAHELFKAVLVGFLVVLAAWLIVYTIGSTVLKDEGVLLLEPNASN